MKRLCAQRELNFIGERARNLRLQAEKPNEFAIIFPSPDMGLIFGPDELSGVRPSLKYSWLASPVRFSNGSTASMRLLGGRRGGSQF